jgi:hypothetical protein
MKRANVSDPVVTFQDAEELERPIDSDDIDRESFLMRDRTEEEVVDYDRSFVAGSEGKEPVTLKHSVAEGLGLSSGLTNKHTEH